MQAKKDAEAKKIADAKAEVFAGLQPGGVAILNRDDTYFTHLETAAKAAQKQAEEALEGASDETDIQRAQSELAEANARYRAAQKLKGVKQ